MLLKLVGQVCAITIKKPLAINQPEVGQFICELRLALGLTQEQFAISLGVKYSTINRWENGHFKPNTQKLSRREIGLNREATATGIKFDHDPNKRQSLLLMLLAIA